MIPQNESQRIGIRQNGIEPNLACACTSKFVVAGSENVHKNNVNVLSGCCDHFWLLVVGLYVEKTW